MAETETTHLIADPQSVADALANRRVYAGAKEVLATLGIADTAILGAIDGRIAEIEGQTAGAIKAYFDLDDSDAPPLVDDNGALYSIDLVTGSPRLDAETATASAQIPLVLGGNVPDPTVPSDPTQPDPTQPTDGGADPASPASPDSSSDPSSDGGSAPTGGAAGSDLPPDA